MNLCIVDFSAIFRTYWHARAGAELDAAYELTMGKIRGVAERFERVAIALDSPRSRRKASSDTYKANREPIDPACVDQMKRAVEVLRLDGFPLFEADGEEGDDVIASFCRWAVAAGHDVTILGCDKDLIQCLHAHVSGPNVVLLNSNRGDLLTAPDVVAKFGVTVEQWIDFQAICGDKADGVRGVDKCGPVNAAKLLTTHGNLGAIVKAALDPESKIHPPSILAALRAAVGYLDKSRELVTLRTDIELPFALVLEPRVQKPIAKTAELPPDDDQGDEEELDDAPAPEAPAPETKPMSEPDEQQQAPTQPNAPSEPFPTEAPAAPASAPAQQAKPSVALAVIDPGDPRYAVALEPRNMQQAAWLAAQAFNSRSFGLPNSETALAAIMIGRSFGVGAMTVLRNVHLIEGKLALHAHLIVGLVMRSPLCEYFDLLESTSKRAVYETKRRGAKREVKMEYTIEDAELAGLLRPTRSGKPSNWTIRPRPLLRKQAGVELARAVYPDITAGMYDPDELESREGPLPGEVIEGEIVAA